MVEEKLRMTAEEGAKYVPYMTDEYWVVRRERYEELEALAEAFIDIYIKTADTESSTGDLIKRHLRTRKARECPAAYPADYISTGNTTGVKEWFEEHADILNGLEYPGAWPDPEPEEEGVAQTAAAD